MVEMGERWIYKLRERRVSYWSEVLATYDLYTGKVPRDVIAKLAKAQAKLVVTRRYR